MIWGYPYFRIPPYGSVCINMGQHGRLLCILWTTSLVAWLKKGEEGAHPLDKKMVHANYIIILHRLKQTV